MFESIIQGIPALSRVANQEICSYADPRGRFTSQDNKDEKHGPGQRSPLTIPMVRREKLFHLRRNLLVSVGERSFEIAMG